MILSLTLVCLGDTTSVSQPYQTSFVRQIHLFQQTDHGSMLDPPHLREERVVPSPDRQMFLEQTLSG
jgi:hypothetical protein